MSNTKLNNVIDGLFQSKELNDILSEYGKTVDDLASLDISIGDSDELGESKASFFPNDFKILISEPFLKQTDDKTVSDVLHHEIVHAIRNLCGYGYSGKDSCTLNDPEELAAVFTDINLKRKEGYSEDEALEYLNQRYSEVGIPMKKLKEILEQSKIASLRKLAEDSPGADVSTIIHDIQAQPGEAGDTGDQPQTPLGMPSPHRLPASLSEPTVLSSPLFAAYSYLSDGSEDKELFARENAVEFLSRLSYALKVLGNHVYFRDRRNIKELEEITSELKESFVKTSTDFKQNLDAFCAGLSEFLVKYPYLNSHLAFLGLQLRDIREGFEKTASLPDKYFGPTDIDTKEQVLTPGEMTPTDQEMWTDTTNPEYALSLSNLPAEYDRNGNGQLSTLLKDILGPLLEKLRNKASWEANISEEAVDWLKKKYGDKTDDRIKMMDRVIDRIVDNSSSQLANRFGVSKTDAINTLTKHTWLIHDLSYLPQGLTEVPALYDPVDDRIMIHVDKIDKAIENESQYSRLATAITHEVEHIFQTATDQLPSDPEELKKFVTDMDEAKIPWINRPIEQGAEIARLRSLLDAGFTENEILDTVHTSQRPDYKRLLEVAKNSEPQSVVASLHFDTDEEARNALDPEGKNHNLNIRCKCGGGSTCRCSAPKILVDVSRCRDCSGLDRQATAPGEKDFKFSSIHVVVPEDLKKELIDWTEMNVSDDSVSHEGDSHGKEDYPHITIKYGIHDIEADSSIALLKDESAITIELGKMSLFKNDEKPYDVLKIEILSPDLHRLNKKISDNLKVTDSFPEYKPHLTLAYVKKGMADKFDGNTEFVGRKFTQDSIEFSSKDKEKGGTKIPLKKAKLTDTMKSDASLSSFSGTLDEMLESGPGLVSDSFEDDSRPSSDEYPYGLRALKPKNVSLFDLLKSLEKSKDSPRDKPNPDRTQTP